MNNDHFLNMSTTFCFHIQHGYRLPEDDQGILYYQLYFKPVGETLFTYPDFCIRQRSPIVLARVDPMPILHAFLSDFRTKLPTICGCPLKLHPKAKFTNNQLMEIHEVSLRTYDSVNNPNLHGFCYR